MAITRNKKEEIVGELNDWAQKSQAIIIVKYGGMTMPQLDKVRHAMRKAEGEFHVTKNTLATKVLKEHGLNIPAKWLTGQTAMSFCFKDPAAVAKSLGDLGKEFDKLQVMGGVMSGTTMDAEGIKALASLPSLDVLRAQIIGALSGPASGLVSVLNAAVGGVMFALQAKIDKEQPAA